MKSGPNGIKTVQTLVYLPYFISTVIVVALLVTLTSPGGVINKVNIALAGSQ